MGGDIHERKAGCVRHIGLSELGAETPLRGKAEGVASLIGRRVLLGAAAALPIGAAWSSAFAQDDGASGVLGFVPDAAALARATTLLRRMGAADLHAHPGRTFARGTPAGAPFEDRAIADMRAGFVTCASFAAVGDRAVLAQGPTGIVLSRELRPGEAWADYKRQIADLKAMSLVNDLTPMRGPQLLASLVPGRDVGALLTVEGGDFLEEDPSRVTEAFDDGVRCITLIHYRPNGLGDNQTSPPTKGGLTSAGAEVVKRMNRLGMLIDVAHAAETTVRQVVERSSAPVMCSHTALKSPVLDHPRFISADTARAVASAGGLIGAWPAGIGATTLSDFVDRIFRIADVVGPDHVALGTDMDANFRPVMTSYRQTPTLLSELLRRGYGESNAGKLMIGNFTRLWRRVSRV